MLLSIIRIFIGILFIGIGILPTVIKAEQGLYLLWFALGVFYLFFSKPVFKGEKAKKTDYFLYGITFSLQLIILSNIILFPKDWVQRLNLFVVSLNERQLIPIMCIIPIYIFLRSVYILRKVYLEKKAQEEKEREEFEKEQKKKLRLANLAKNKDKLKHLSS